MKAPTKVIFAFDPDQANISVLSDTKGRILWACIRYQHIVSQYFNGNVQDVVLRIAEEKPTTYDAFKEIISTSGLRIFGTNCIGFGGGYPKLDDEFWQGVWKYIKGEEKLIIEQS